MSQWIAGETIPAPAMLARLADILSLTATQAAELYEAAGVPLPAALLALLPREAA